MTARTYENHVTAKKNEAVQISQPLQPVESVGPVTLLLQNQGLGNVVLQAKRRSDGAILTSDKDTVVADEDTVYNGDTSTLVFSGEALDNTPIIPGTVVIKPTAGGASVNLTDRDGDGRLYTADVDEDFAGTVDYFTGALELAFPAGKPPNTGDIDADYSHQDSATVPGGRKNFAFPNVLQEDAVIPAVATDADDGSFCKIDGIATWI